MQGFVSALEMFRAQASKSPERTAVRDSAQELDYAKLDVRSAQLAQLLSERGVNRGSLVAVVLDRSVDLVVGLLAVLRAGAAYIPISPDDPADRVSFLLEDARPSLVIASVRHSTRMAWLDPGIVYLVDAESEQAPDLASHATVAALPPSLTPSDAAYVIYTSGSTGRPKGVVVEHGALSSYLEYVVANYPSVARRALLHSSVSFDMAVTSLYGPIITGGTVDIVDFRSASSSPPPAANAGSPSFLKVTPSHLAMLRALPDWCSPTEQLVVGGEALTAAQLQPWWDEHSGVTVVNEYGPTEASVGCCAYPAQHGSVADGTRVPIGRPGPGTHLYVLDERLKPAPAGEAGELHIAGTQLARGYLHRPGGTASAFVADPFGPRGGRMYRTGDLVRERPDGTLEFLGRADDQIKINGYRVEPGEIQAVLTDHTMVAQVFVTFHARGSASPRLTAFVVPADVNAWLDLDELRQLAATRLPEYMVPLDFVSLPALPLTANGKVDQDALPNTPPRNGNDGDNATGARTPEEALLCRMVIDLTGVSAVSIDDDFFRLGGSSIAAARLVTRARREGIGLTLETVLKSRTIRRMLARSGAGHPRDPVNGRRGPEEQQTRNPDREAT